MPSSNKSYPSKSHILEKFPYTDCIFLKIGENTGIEDEQYEIKFCRYNFTCSFVLIEWITERKYRECRQDFKRMEDTEAFLDYIIDNKLESDYTDELCP